MPKTTAGMAKKTSQKSNARMLATDGASLDRRYGQIGISAVAAAVRYQGGAKNPAYAPAQTRWQARAEEAVA
jgi:hypothetical protein